MSKRSRERKRLMKLAADYEDRMKGKQPITGDMAERVSTIVKVESSGDSVSQSVDSRLPIHYGGYATAGMNGNRQHQYQPQPADDSIFHITTKDVFKECPISPVPKVHVAARLWQEWINLAEAYETEWLAYLVGRLITDDSGSYYEISKMYFPPQVATGSHVDVDDSFSSYQPNTIGAIHSHVKMGVFFSAEDMAHSNWPVEIVVNAQGEGKVIVRQQLECGRCAKNYSEILTTGDSVDSRYVSALDKAFESGEQLRIKRVRERQAEVGYRTPEPSIVATDVHISRFKESLQPSRPDNSTTWPFQISGRPHRWDDKRESYREIIQVNGEWVDRLDHEKEILTKVNPMSEQQQLDLMNQFDGSIVIDDATGQILVDGEKSQAEVDSGMEAEVDRYSCSECGGTGMIETQGAKVACVSCGGDGIDPKYYTRYLDGYGYTC